MLLSFRVPQGGGSKAREVSGYIPHGCSMKARPALPDA